MNTVGMIMFKVQSSVVLELKDILSAFIPAFYVFESKKKKKLKNKKILLIESCVGLGE